MLFALGMSVADDLWTYTSVHADLCQHYEGQKGNLLAYYAEVIFTVLAYLQINID